MTDRDTLASELEQVLAGMVRLHEQMLRVTREHRAAIASADAEKIGACVRTHAELFQAVQELERRRRSAVAQLTAGEGRKRPPTMTELAASLSEPWRERAGKLASQLKTTLETLSGEQRTVRLATESLLGHMDGLLRQVAKKLSHAGTYSARGVVEAGRQQVVSGLDVTS